MGQARRRLYTQPTPMGERILAFMSANYVTDMAEFAEGLVGVPTSTLMAWIYEPLDPEELPVKAILLLADALGTNAEYLTCISNDPRQSFQLTYDEGVLLQTFRDTDDAGREQLMKNLLEIAAASQARPNPGSPFPNVPRRRKPPRRA